jgi:hypothetical protein
MSLRLYRVGGVYETAPALANLLVVEGYAIFELRDDRPSQPRPVERRKKR